MGFSGLALVWKPNVPNVGRRSLVHGNPTWVALAATA